MKRIVAGTCVLLAAASASADEAALLEKIEALEQRVQQLEAEQVEQVEHLTRTSESSAAADWTRHVRLSGSADTGFFGGERNSFYDPEGFKIYDSRFFLDAYLGQDVRLSDVTLFRDVGFHFEWNLVRLTELENDVGELYANFQGIAGSDWLNMQLGRFQIPIGEAYLDYSTGYAGRYFVSNSIGPWFWDEGVKFYGSSTGSEDYGHFGYVASVSDGDTPFNMETDADKQLTLKLFYDPWRWLHVSASAARTGKLGNASQNASGAIWLGESWARPVGAGTAVPTFQDGVAVVDASRRIDDSWLLGADAIADFEDKLRVWLSYGRYEIDANNGGFYDRTLYYWIAEAILRGAWLAEPLRPFYAGVRAQGLGTYNDDKGYLLDVNRSDTLGWNMKSLNTYSGVLGWDINEWLRVRSEYSRQDIELVHGVTEDIRRNARDADFYSVELGISF